MSETAIITGASTGIGKSLSLQMADAGYRIILVARSENKLDAIAKENKSLRQRIKKLEAAKDGEWSSSSKKSSKKNYRSSSRKTGLVETNHRYSYEILNPLWDLSSKPKLILDKLKDGSVLKDSVSLSGSVFAIADYQKSNTDDKF